MFEVLVFPSSVEWPRIESQYILQKFDRELTNSILYEVNKKWTVKQSKQVRMTVYFKLTPTKYSR